MRVCFPFIETFFVNTQFVESVHNLALCQDEVIYLSKNEINHKG